MKIKLIKIGPIKTKEIDTLYKDYVKRLSRFAQIETLFLKDPEESPTKKTSPFDLFLSKTTTSEKIYLLDERGEQMSSISYSSFLKKQIDTPAVKSLCLVVGGAYGFSDDHRSQANGLISLSNMVFPNELAWLILTEQTYRGFSILAGTNYHHA